MGYNVHPGVKAIITGSINGEKSKSINRIVQVYADRGDHPGGEFDQAYCDRFNDLGDPKHYCPPSPYEKEHTQWGKIWPVRPIDGKGPIADNFGHSSEYVDVPDRFLRRLLPDEEKGLRVTAKKEEA